MGIIKFKPDSAGVSATPSCGVRMMLGFEDRCPQRNILHNFFLHIACHS